MSEQTAVQWLIEEVKKFNTVITKEYMLMLFQQALEMERQQVIDAVDGFPIENRNLDGSEYYTQTFTEPKTD